MKHANVYQPFFLSSLQRVHTLTLNDLKWMAFEAHDFLGDGEDWALVIENMLLEKNPEVLKKIKFGEQRDMFCISSEDKDSLHVIAEMVAEFYEDRALLEEQIEKYAKY